MDLKTKTVFSIAITGPESTGKSWLTKQLATHYGTVSVPEYARRYIDELNRPYRYEDIELIAKTQLDQELNAKMQAENFLFVDTDFFVTKIWSEFVFQKCSSWICQQLLDHPYDLHLLCNIDLPWEYDPQREHPHKRQRLFEIYKTELIQSKRPFEIVSGYGEARLQSALMAIQKHFSNVEHPVL